MRPYVLLCLVAVSLASPCFAEAMEHDKNSPASLSDLDLGRAYLEAQQDGQETHHWTFLEIKGELQKRGSTQMIEAIYDGYVSSACPRDSFTSGYARIKQDGAELRISRDAKSLLGVVVKDAIIAVIPPKQEFLVGTIFDDRIDLVATTGSCSISFARAINLHDAVRSGDVEVVRSVIESGVDVNEPDLWGTPLGIAVIKGSDQIVQLLLDAGADIEGATLPAVGGERPLHLAATRTWGASTARLLVSRGARLDGRDKAGRTPLITAILASNFQVADVLLAAGADIEAVDGDLDGSPLYWATCEGRYEGMKFLLARGAQINRKTGPKGNTPLHCAVTCKHKTFEGIRFLVANGADVNATNNSGLTPLQLSDSEKEKEFLRSLGATK
jgi:ankyrin repeat protein